jgi:hypothetical protein
VRRSFGTTAPSPSTVTLASLAFVAVLKDRTTTFLSQPHSAPRTYKEKH